MPTVADAKIQITAIDKTKQAFQSVNSSLGGLKQAVFSARGALAGLTGGAVFKSLDAFGKSALAANVEFLNFSKRLGAGAGGLSELAVAGDLAGVSMSQVNLAVQRATRRVGEAAQGYGEAKKALEQLGLSANELTKISADKQFNMLADSLLAVENRSQRLTLAFKLFDSEGTAVIQMLDRLEEARNLAASTGAVISQEELTDMEQFRDETAKTEAAYRSLQQAFISTGIPRTLEIIKQSAIELGEVFVDLFSTVGKGIGALAASFSFAVQGEFSTALQVFKEYADEVSDLWGAQTGAAGSASGGILGGGSGADTKKVKQTFDDILATLIDQTIEVRSQVEGWNLVYRQTKAVLDAEKALGQSLTDDQKERLRGYVAELDNLNKRVELERESKSLVEGLRTPMEALNAELLKGRQLYEDGFFGPTGTDAAIEQLFRLENSVQERMDAIDKDTKEATDNMSEYAIQAARNMQSAFADYLFDPFQEEGLKGMLDGFVVTLRKMAAEAAAANIFDSIGSSGIGKGVIGSALGFLGIGGRRALGGPVASGMPYLVGENGPELYVPKTAGNIVPNDALGALTVNVNVSGSQLPAARQSANQIGQDIGRSINLSMRRNG